MAMAEQHQIVDIVGQKRRTDFVAAWAGRRLRNDVCDETEVLVLGARDEIADQGCIAAIVGAAASRSRPEHVAGRRCDGR